LPPHPARSRDGRPWRLRGVVFRPRWLTIDGERRRSSMRLQTSLPSFLSLRHFSSLVHARSGVWPWQPVERWWHVARSFADCRMDLPGPTTSVGTRTDYSVSPWDYLTCVARYLLA
jgi:hypothetical protein